MRFLIERSRLERGGDKGDIEFSGKAQGIGSTLMSLCCIEKWIGNIFMRWIILRENRLWY
jgi:hypothetical protein